MDQESKDFWAGTAISITVVVIVVAALCLMLGFCRYLGELHT